MFNRSVSHCKQSNTATNAHRLSSKIYIFILIIWLYVHRHRLELDARLEHGRLLLWKMHEKWTFLVWFARKYIYGWYHFSRPMKINDPALVESVNKFIFPRILSSFALFYLFYLLCRRVQYRRVGMCCLVFGPQNSCNFLFISTFFIFIFVEWNWRRK